MAAEGWTDANGRRHWLMETAVWFPQIGFPSHLPSCVWFEEGGAGRKNLLDFSPADLSILNNNVHHNDHCCWLRVVHCIVVKSGAARQEMKEARNPKPQSPIWRWPPSDLAGDSGVVRQVGRCPRLPVSSTIGSVVPGPMHDSFFPVLVPCLPVQPPESQPHPTPSLVWGCWGRPSHHFCVMHHPFLSPSA